ncbi:MAG TPA: type II toxin-antitoxin system VapC family toxin [Polyangia bacterium]|nr:type II toxin-antitoxin system VapC family toxin [Polyangia bacterium]
MSFLVDTHVITEIRKGARADQRVLRWLKETDDDDLRLSVLVLGELRQGVERLRARDGASALRLDHWLGGLAERYKGRILPVDEPVAQLWGRLNVPDPLPAVDGLLAATALIHDLTLVTRNTRDVARTGARLLNPFDRRG